MVMGCARVAGVAAFGPCCRFRCTVDLGDRGSHLGGRYGPNCPTVPFFPWPTP